MTAWQRWALLRFKGFAGQRPLRAEQQHAQPFTQPEQTTKMRVAQQLSFSSKQSFQPCSMAAV